MLLSIAFLTVTLSRRGFVELHVSPHRICVNCKENIVTLQRRNLVDTTLIEYSKLKPSVIGQVGTEMKRETRHVTFLQNVSLGFHHEDIADSPKLDSIQQNNQSVIFKSVKNMTDQEGVPS